MPVNTTFVPRFISSPTIFVNVVTVSGLLLPHYLPLYAVCVSYELSHTRPRTYIIHDQHVLCKIRKTATDRKKKKTVCGETVDGVGPAERETECNSCSVCVQRGRGQFRSFGFETGRALSVCSIVRSGALHWLPFFLSYAWNAFQYWMGQRTMWSAVYFFYRFLWSLLFYQFRLFDINYSRFPYNFFFPLLPTFFLLFWFMAPSGQFNNPHCVW